MKNQMLEKISLFCLGVIPFGAETPNSENFWGQPLSFAPSYEAWESRYAPFSQTKAPVVVSASAPRYFSASIGFTNSPDSFLVGAALSYPLDENFSIGPLVQLGIDDDFFMAAPTLDLRATFALSEDKRVRPFIHGGPGFVYFKEDDRVGDDDETGFLFNLGVGIDYLISDDTTIGTDLMVNYMPDEVLGEHGFFSWQFLKITFHF